MAAKTNLPATQTSGNVLTAAWLNDLRGAFRILDIVNASTATLQSSTSATFTDIGLSVTITPQSTSNKILLLLSQNTYTDTATTGVGIQIVRGATSLIAYSQASYGTASGNVNNNFFTYVDSPATTSATTYKVQMCRSAGAGTAFTQISANTSTLYAFEVSL